MRVGVLQVDERTEGLLAVLARRRGHEVFTLRRDELASVPITPTAVIIDAEDDGAAGVVRAIRDRFPGVLAVVTSRTGVGDGSGEGLAEIVPKPYNPLELMRRLERWHTLLQAADRESDLPPGHAVGDLLVDLERLEATKNGRRLELTRLELRLLYCLAASSPSPASTEKLLGFGWDLAEEPDCPTLKTHISHLRKKLSAAGGVALQLRSYRNLGYSLDVQG